MEDYVDPQIGLAFIRIITDKPSAEEDTKNGELNSNSYFNAEFNTFPEFFTVNYPNITRNYK